jgi:hypothetical protein
LKTTPINSNSKFTKEKEMADFRKLFLVLMVLALVALPVSAITPPRVNCTASSSPVIIRDGGLTELVGDVTLSCDNTAQGAVDVQTDIQIFMNFAPVTNKVLNSTGTGGECPTHIKCVTDSVVAASWIGPAPTAPGVVDPGTSDPTYITGLLQSRLDVTGDPANQRNSILFPLVPVPAGTITYIRISNVRISPTGVQPNGITSIYEQITTNNVVITTNNVLPVATVLVPLQFQTTLCDGTAASVPTFQQCIAHNPNTGSMTTTFNAQFIEGFALAFKPRINETTGTIIVGNKFLSESGYLLGDLTSPGGSTVKAVGEASTGTNLILTFTNIPAGVHIFVTKNETVTGTSAGALPDDNVAIQASTTSTATGTVSCGLLTGSEAPDQGMNAVEVALTGGIGKATWVVTAIDPNYNYQKTISFGVAVSYVPNTSVDLPGLTTPPGGSVAGSIGPTPFTNDSALPISSSAPIPRFRDNHQGATVFGIVPCVTNILFPYVTAKAGFDTGIALVNTSADSPVLSTPTQHGSCKMYYFDGTATPPAAQTTCDIKAGGMFTFSMMTQGGIPSETCADSSTVTNVAVPIGWQGYAIASCRFQYGRGFAFISDRNTPSLGSQGYLPLILPACTQGRSPNPFDGQPRGLILNHWDDCGESLGM